jgi:hypothetical protein
MKKEEFIKKWFLKRSKRFNITESIDDIAFDLDILEKDGKDFTKCLVKIVKNTSSHRFEIGEIVCIIDYNTIWSCPFRAISPSGYMWFLNEVDFEKVKEDDIIKMFREKRGLVINSLVKFNISSEYYIGNIGLITEVGGTNQDPWANVKVFRGDSVFDSFQISERHLDILSGSEVIQFLCEFSDIENSEDFFNILKKCNYEKSSENPSIEDVVKTMEDVFINSSNRSYLIEERVIENPEGVPITNLLDLMSSGTVGVENSVANSVSNDLGINEGEIVDTFDEHFREGVMQYLNEVENPGSVWREASEMPVVANFSDTGLFEEE